MKKLLAAAAGIIISFGAMAQTTAQDWTKPDCAGKNHHLFAELDSSKVIVLEYVMMSCAPCVTAGQALKTIAAPYQTSHPDRVRLYSIGYINSYTCAQMQNWQTTNNFTHPVFTGGASDVAYYGGMGMPTIVVVGNSSHKVYYKKQGYAASDNAAIQAAIDLALAEGNVTGLKKAQAEKLKLQIYPNPANALLHLHFAPGTSDAVSVTDLTGRQVLSAEIKDLSATQISVRELPSGVYLLHFRKNGQQVYTTRFVKE